VNKPVVSADGDISEAASTLIPAEDETPENFPYIAAISTDEHLRIWDLETDQKNPIVKAKVGGRLTCMTCAVVPQPSADQMNTKKRKKSTGDSENDDSFDSLEESEDGEELEDEFSDEEEEKPSKKRTKVEETREDRPTFKTAQKQKKSSKTSASASAAAAAPKKRYLKFGSKKHMGRDLKGT